MVTMRDLTTPAMIYSIREMLERPECIAIFEKYPILLGFKPELEEAYKALVASRPVAAEPTNESETLQIRLARLDQRHDLINNVVYRLMGVAAQILTNAEYRTLFARLQEQLYPHRLRVNLFKRSEEAAEALRLKKQLDNSPEARKALDALELTYGKDKLCAGRLLDELFEVADEMNACLRQIAGLPPETKTQPDTEARKMFVAWMSRFQDSAQLALRKEPALLAQLFAPLEQKLKEAEAAENATQQQPPVTPTPDPTPNETL